MSRVRRFIFFVVANLVLATTALGQTYDDALKLAGLATAAQLRIGALYAGEADWPRDDLQAEHWLLAAARQGNVADFSNLAALYEAPQNTAPDLLRAYMWYSMVDGAVGWMQRVKLQSFLLPEQRLEAESMAVTCRESDYFDC